MTPCGHNHLVRLGEEGSIEFSFHKLLTITPTKMITITKATEEAQEAIVVVCVVR